MGFTIMNIIMRHVMNDGCFYYLPDKFMVTMKVMVLISKEIGLLFLLLNQGVIIGEAPTPAYGSFIFANVILIEDFQ